MEHISHPTLDQGFDLTQEGTAPALARGLRIMTNLAIDGSASLERLCKRLNLPKTSCARLLTNLCDMGLVERDPISKRYSARHQLCPLITLPTGTSLAATMNQLCQATGLTVEVWEYQKPNLVLIDRREADEQEVAVTARIGFSRNLEEIEAVTQIALAYFTPDLTPSQPWRWQDGQVRQLQKADLVHILDQTRSNGVATEISCNSNGVRRYACRIPGLENSILAIAQFCGPGANTPDQHLIDQLTMVLRDLE